MKYLATLHDQIVEIEINTEGEITVDGQRLSLDFQPVMGQLVYSLLLRGESYEASVQSTDEGWQVLLGGQLYQVMVEDERQRRLREASGTRDQPGGEFHLKAPMPGLIVTIPVEEGQQVEKGDDLVVLESMKMQNELKAPREGTITRVQVAPGDSVEQNQVLVILN
jgi:biotin carboxyl carrier protein